MQHKFVEFETEFISNCLWVNLIHSNFQIFKKGRCGGCENTFILFLLATVKLKIDKKPAVMR